MLNGVYMTPSFDGHLQNMNFLFSGSPFGGNSFIPHLNSAETGRPPGSLDAVLPTAPVFVNVNNHSSVVPLEPNCAASSWPTRLREAEPPHADDMLGQFIRSRLTAGASGEGRMAAGARLMLSSLDQAPDVHRKLAALRVPREDLAPEAQAVALIAECFRLSLSRSAIYVLREQFDVHDADQAKLQPKLFADAVLKIAGLFRGPRRHAVRRQALDVRRDDGDGRQRVRPHHARARHADRRHRHQPQSVRQLDPARRQGHPQRAGGRRLGPRRREGRALQGAPAPWTRCSRRSWAGRST